MKTLAIDTTPIAATRDRSETNDTSLQLFACCALVLLSGGACSCEHQVFLRTSSLEYCYQPYRR
jgi:hypothetical protein